MRVDVRQVYALGCVLALVGGVVTFGSLVLAGEVTTSLIALGSTTAIVLALKNVYTQDRFDRDHSLPYRVTNWVGSVMVVGFGLVMVAAGVYSYWAFV